MSKGLMHRHGGDILAVAAIGHETYKGVADWFFVGDVKWADGTESKGHRIAPHALVYEADNAEGRQLHLLLSDYLIRNGQWHDAKHKRDGRVYHWTPTEPNGSEPVAAEAE